jgi:hypothetical protein
MKSFRCLKRKKIVLNVGYIDTNDLMKQKIQSPDANNASVLYSKIRAQNYLDKENIILKY